MDARRSKGNVRLINYIKRKMKITVKKKVTVKRKLNYHGQLEIKMKIKFASSEKREALLPNNMKWINDKIAMIPT